MVEGTDVENALDYDEKTERQKDEIREGIEETRAQMGETIEALQEKLSLSNISDSIKDEVSEQVSHAVQTTKDVVYDATINNASRFFNRVKNEMKQIDLFSKDSTYLLPMGLIGFGIGLAIYNYSSGSGSKSSGYRRPTPKRGNGSSQESSQSLFGTAKNTVGDTAGKAYSQVRDTASSTYSQVRDTASSAYHAIEDGSVSLKNKAGELASSTRNQYDRLMDENPLALGAAAAALGVVAGLAIPTTSTERRYLGEASGSLISKAEDAVQDAVGQFKDAAGKLTDEMRSEGSSTSPGNGKGQQPQTNA